MAAFSAANAAQTSTGSMMGFSVPDLAANAGSLYNTAQANNLTSTRINQAEAYNTQMADTVYQRGVADMKAAGLNPILAAGSPDPMASAVMAPGQSASVAPTVGMSFSHSAAGANAPQFQAQVAQAGLTDAQQVATLAAAGASNASATKSLADAGVSAQENRALQNSNTFSDAAAAVAKNHPGLTGTLQYLKGTGLNVSSAVGAAAGAATGMAGIP